MSSSIARPARLDVWYALGQFSRMFTFPLLLFYYRGWDFRSYFTGSIDGRDVEQVARAFGPFERWLPRTLLDIALPLMLQHRADKSPAAPKAHVETRGGDASTQVLNLSRLRSKIQKLAARGNRIVAAMEMDPDAETPHSGALENMWHVRFGLDSNRTHSSLLYFADAANWKVLESIGPKLFAIERPFGKGSIVLLAASGDFNNQSTIAADRLNQVSAAIGPNTRIIFD